MHKQGHPYDAFISHAVEDKLPIANELCQRLEQAGLKIWYSGKELSVGDSVNDTICEGLKQSRFGVVILSKNYVEKTWTLRELFDFVSKEQDGRKRVLPVLHNISVDELAFKHLPLGDRFALKAERGMDYVVNGLLREIRKEKKIDADLQREASTRKWLQRVFGVVIVASVVTWLGFTTWRHQISTEQFVERLVAQRIEDFDDHVRIGHLTAMQVEHGRHADVSEVDSANRAYQNNKSHYRNEYTLVTGYSTITSKKNVSDKLKLNVEDLYPGNKYTLVNSEMVLFDTRQASDYLTIRYALLNKEAVTAAREMPEGRQDDKFDVHVDYTNNIRYISVTLTFPIRGDIKRREVDIMAIPPEETYTFEKQSEEWTLISVK